MLRQSAVAGQFYPDDPRQLAGMIDAFLKTGAEPTEALLAICPHAGYVYSGAVAGRVLSRVAVPRKVVVLGPNHRGVGRRLAVMTEGAWLTPLGQVEIDTALGRDLVATCALAENDALAHKLEHSLEVQVPFLQRLRPDLLLTPVCVSMLTYDECATVGQALARVIEQAGEPVLMVASTDMTHYESAEAARAKDELAIKQMLELNPEGLYKVVRDHDISMCGVLATTIALEAALGLGASRSELVAYTNSGEVSGDFRQVVGYAGIIIS